MGDPLIGTRHSGSLELKTGTNWSRADIKRHQKTGRNGMGPRWYKPVSGRSVLCGSWDT